MFNYIKFILPINLFLLLLCMNIGSCWFSPDGEFDGKLKVTNNSNDEIFVLVNNEFPDTSTSGLQFSAKAGQTKSLAIAGSNSWELLLKNKEIITVFFFDIDKIDLPRSDLFPFIKKKYIVDTVVLDSLNWLLVFP